MMIRTNFSEAFTTAASPNFSESARLSKRVVGHHVSAPLIPTSTFFPSFFAPASAGESGAFRGAEGHGQRLLLLRFRAHHAHLHLRPRRGRAQEVVDVVAR